MRRSRRLAAAVLWTLYGTVPGPAHVAAQASPSDPADSFRSRIENDPVLWVMGVAIAAFGSGAGAVAFLIRERRGRQTPPAPAAGHLPPTGPNLDGILEVFPRTSDATKRDLLARLDAARRRIRVFGLTRNYYVHDEVQDLLRAKARRIPIHMYMMDPSCASRVDRYRLEPTEAAFEDPERYRREVEGPFLDLLSQVPPSEASSTARGLSVYYFDFPCSFAIEEIDDVVRVMLYGHGKRGTESPMFIVAADSEIGSYFVSQLDWIESLAGLPRRPWADKGIHVRRLMPNSAPAS